jgi:hypothetical protein
MYFEQTCSMESARYRDKFWIRLKCEFIKTQLYRMISCYV